MATAADFRDADADPHAVGQECVGRHLGALSRDGGKASRGCNWTAYGFFRGPWIITMPDGKEAGAFPVAPAPGERDG